MESKASRIEAAYSIDVGNSETREAAFEWLMNAALQFQAVFIAQLKQMKI